MGCFQLWDDRSSSAQPTGRAVVQEVTRPFLPLVWYRKGARKSFPFQVHNIYTYPCQPALGEAQQAELKGAVQELPGTAGIGLANWNWKAVHQFVSERFGLSLSRSCCLNYLHRLGFVLKRPKKAVAEGGRN